MGDTDNKILGGKVAVRIFRSHAEGWFPLPGSWVPGCRTRTGRRRVEEIYTRTIDHSESFSSSSGGL